MIWLCFTLVLAFTSVISDQNVDSSHIRGKNQSVAGVFQVSDLNYLNQPQYSYNASDARSLCLSLGVYIASKAQVQEALTRGLETCRFGWIDEHLAVIPRVKALPNCGQNKMGLVTWRVNVIKKLDVFCFDESVFFESSKLKPDLALYVFLHPFPFLFLLNSYNHRLRGRTRPVCGRLTKLCWRRRSRAVSTDIKQAEEYIQTVEWTSEERTEKTEEAAQEDERMEDERMEDERIEDERMEDERIEDERIEDERMEDERIEDERMEDERIEVEENAR
ncbi:hypothetical protein F7725_026330 [Dissostichus mawsoni]|uniref:Link domain-containing protein n=1 Tax=Dissostichus mawsoni TaxID=36200 RepID=A0A7J5X6U0_DISMA|nr:hypothetical protein F7725_026330 [Dissostichus mawsoni]